MRFFYEVIWAIPLTKAFPTARVGLSVAIFLPHPKSLSKGEGLPATKKDFHYYPYCSFARKKVFKMNRRFPIVYSFVKFYVFANFAFKFFFYF